MVKFGAALAKKKFNAAVAAHTKSGLNATQLRPKIKSIGKRREGGSEVLGFYRAVTYADSTIPSIQAEQDIASIVHSYTALVGGLTGNVSLILLPYWFEFPAARGVKALPPIAGIGIRIGMGYLFASFKSKKGKADSEEISHEIHDGIRDAFPKFCKK